MLDLRGSMMGTMTLPEVMELKRREALRQRAQEEVRVWEDLLRIVDFETKNLCGSILKRLGADARHEYQFNTATGEVVLAQMAPEPEPDVREVKVVGDG